MTFEELLPQLTPRALSLAPRIHQLAVENGCKYKITRRPDGMYEIFYSMRNIILYINGEWVDYRGDYDIRAYLKLFNETDDLSLKKLMFEKANACSYCINDKCTTFLMSKQRTIEFEGKTKKLCGPFWGSAVYICLDGANIDSALKIEKMMFEYTYPYMQKNLEYTNEVSYSVVQKNEFYILGYMARHNPLSKSDEELVASVLKADGDGKRKADILLEAARQEDAGEYIGATDKFVNGNTYEFIFGIKVDKKPENIPEGAVCRKIRDGEWAVYNSTAGDYPSIWHDFTANFYNKEHKGYDTARIPFEYYGKDGKFRDVHIPVDADMPADSGKTVTMLHLPTLRVAGYFYYCEKDYPLSKDFSFDINKRMREAFPYAEKIIGMSIHSHFGRPMANGFFYDYDDLMPVPDDMEKRELKAGWFLIEGRKHFNGGVSEYPFDRPMNFRTGVDDMHHPGLWIDFTYTNARGGYYELGNPAQIKGNKKYEVVDLPPQRVIGKLEAPPESIVTDEDKKRFYSLPENKEKGSYMISYTIIKAKKSGIYFDKPLIKGVLSNDNTPVPEGMSAFYLGAGRYVKITEDVPNGEPGWEIEWLPETVEKETGYTVDDRKQFIVKQNDFGRSYEFYIPCGEYVGNDIPPIDDILGKIKVKNSENIDLADLAGKSGTLLENGMLNINIRDDGNGKNRPYTKNSYSLPLKIDVKAQTDDTNIRLYYNNGELILNWECNKQELRIHDPVTGQPLGFNGGYVEENRKHDISWIINRDFMAVIVDGEVRHYRKGYDYIRFIKEEALNIKSPVGVCSCWGSKITVSKMVISELE